MQFAQVRLVDNNSAMLLSISLIMSMCAVCTQRHCMAMVNYIRIKHFRYTFESCIQR